MSRPAVFFLNFFCGCIVCIVLSVLTPGISSGQIKAQTMPCWKQLEMYQADRVTPGLAAAARDWYCPDPNARVLPVKKPHAGNHHFHPSGSYGKKDFQMQMMHGILGATFQSIFVPPAQSPYQEQLKEHQELKKKQKSLENWKKLQAEEKTRLSEQEAKKRKQGEDLLTKMGSLSGESVQSGGAESGRLEPFTWESARAELKPLGTGRFDTSSLSAWQRMVCASYFSSMALNEVSNGNPEGASYLNSQADSVASGGMTELECSFSILPQVPESQKNVEKMQRIREIFKAVYLKVKDLQDIETKLAEAKKQKQKVETKLKESEARISETGIPEKADKTPGQFDADDDLMNQMVVLRLQAEEQLEDAERIEQHYTEMKNKSLDEIKNMEKSAMKEFD